MTLIEHRVIKLSSDGNETTEATVIEKIILILTDFKKKFNIKDDTMIESDLKKVYNGNINY